MDIKDFFITILQWWKTWVLILTPIILIPIVTVNPSPVSNCAYILLLMGVYWVTETLPIPVTSLLPLILVPGFGLMEASKISLYYFKDVIVLFIAGLLVAICIEKSNLHKRIALRALLFVGTTPKWLMLGFMVPTWFLSMWISNTATTAMMFPIVKAVLEQMKKEDLRQQKKPSPGVNSVAEDHELEEKEPLQTEVKDVDDLENACTSKEYLNIAKAMSLCIAYAANTGGISTLTGTPPNLVFKGVADTLSNRQSGVTFTSWMAFAVPLSLIAVIFCWVWLQIYFTGFKKTFEIRCKQSKESSEIRNIIRREYFALGNLRWAEGASLIFFIILAIIWLTREPSHNFGWGTLFQKGFVSDGTGGMLVAVFLFVIPSERPVFGRNKQLPPPLLTWKDAAENIPWDVCLLLGGGFALAGTCQSSGLSDWCGSQLAALGHLPTWAIAVIICTMTAGFTEFTSNTATTTLLLPIVANLATNIGINPLYLMIGTTVSASFAFMLPVATAPNAIVFSYRYLRIIDMMLAGIFTNIICIVIVSIGLNTWGVLIFDLNNVPAWAGGLNTTVSPIMNTTVKLLTTNAQ